MPRASRARRAVCSRSSSPSSSRAPSQSSSRSRPSRRWSRPRPCSPVWPCSSSRDLRRGLPGPHRERPRRRHVARDGLHRRDGGHLRLGAGDPRRGRHAAPRGDHAAPAGHPRPLQQRGVRARRSGRRRGGRHRPVRRASAGSPSRSPSGRRRSTRSTSRSSRSSSAGGRGTASSRSSAAPSRSTFIAFAIMASLTLMLAVLWERSPFLSAALVGPLAAIALYQRSVFRELDAMRLALTDPLTGLGNHRHFHERLGEALVEAEEKGLPLSVCILDIDNFKEVNDRLGHPKGDHVLAQVAARLRQDGEAFRIGGDEFALLLPGKEERGGGRRRGRRARAGGAARGGAGSWRSASRRESSPTRSRASTAPTSSPSPTRRSTWRRRTGRARCARITPTSESCRPSPGSSTAPEREARLHAAASLAHAVDARDAYTGRHSYMVSELAARVADAPRPDGRGDRARATRGQPPRPRQAGRSPRRSSASRAP